MPAVMALADLPPAYYSDAIPDIVSALHYYLYFHCLFSPMLSPLFITPITRIFSLYSRHELIRHFHACYSPAMPAERDAVICSFDDALFAAATDYVIDV